MAGNVHRIPLFEIHKTRQLCHLQLLKHYSNAGEFVVCIELGHQLR